MNNEKLSEIQHENSNIEVGYSMFTLIDTQTNRRHIYVTHNTRSNVSINMRQIYTANKNKNVNFHLIELIAAFKMCVHYTVDVDMVKNSLNALHEVPMLKLNAQNYHSVVALNGI